MPNVGTLSSTESNIARLRENLPQLDAALLDTLLTTVPVGFAFFDRDLRYQLVNEAMAEINGVPAADHVGRTVAELLPNLNSSVSKNLREVLETGVPLTNCEVVGETPAHLGEQRSWLVSYYPVRDSGGNVLGAGAIVTEITERKRAQDALAHKSLEILTIFESITDAFFALDKEWRFTYVNGEAERLLQRSREEILGNSIWSEFPESVSSLFWDEYHRALRDQVTVSFSTFYQPLNIWFDVRAYPSSNGLSVYFRDITDQKADEEQKNRLQREVQEAALRQRRFLQEMLAAMTEGKLRLLNSADELPPTAEPFGEPFPLTLQTLRPLRHKVREAAMALGLPDMRWQDLESSVGEATENAIVHAGGGEARIYVNRETQTVQVWIEDRGGGIEESKLHRATLERGFTTAGTMGHGFFFILRTADRVWLLTSNRGTTVVLEQDKIAPLPNWLRIDEPAEL